MFAVTVVPLKVINIGAVQAVWYNIKYTNVSTLQKDCCGSLCPKNLWSLIFDMHLLFSGSFTNDAMVANSLSRG